MKKEIANPPDAVNSRGSVAAMLGAIFLFAAVLGLGIAFCSIPKDAMARINKPTPGGGASAMTVIYLVVGIAALVALLPRLIQSGYDSNVGSMNRNHEAYQNAEQAAFEQNIQNINRVRQAHGYAPRDPHTGGEIPPERSAMSTSELW